MLSRVKKNDLVVVTSGKDRGKEGTVIAIDSKKGSVLIKGVGMVTRHVKAKRQGEKGGIKKEERYFPLCKVMPVCRSCKKACRVQMKIDGKKKTRTCHRCKESF